MYQDIHGQEVFFVKFLRQTLAVVLAFLMLAVPAAAAESDGWLVPKMREAPNFTDTAGTICQDAARICCEAGLMTGVDAKHFMPETGLTNAQIIVISARLHRLLKTGSIGEFDSYHLPKDQWWNPYDKYLREQIPALAGSEDYGDMCGDPGRNCYRKTFFLMLAEILESAGTELPVINDVDAVPDCADPKIIQFYRGGVLGGKDAYGTLVDGPLSRAAASSMLARLIDPAQRLQLNLKQLELCQELLQVEPDTVLFFIDGQEVTAEQFIPSLASTLFSYNHSHFGAMGMEGRLGELSMNEVARLIQAETMARDAGLAFPESDEVYYDGYKGLTAKAQEWDALHRKLLELVEIPDGTPLPQVRYAAVWDTFSSEPAWIMESASTSLEQLPYWGGWM